MTTIRSMLAGAVALVASLGLVAEALAQTPPTSPPTRLRGSIAAIDGKTATIATREGTSVPVKLADNWAVMLVSPMTMADIKENSFVGIASLKGPDGTLNALEVLIFPEAARGSDEGHYPWDLQPESMMTNATVATVAAAPDGQTLTLEVQGRHADHQGEAGDAYRDLRARRPRRRQGRRQGVPGRDQGRRRRADGGAAAGGQGWVDAADVGLVRLTDDVKMRVRLAH